MRTPIKLFLLAVVIILGWFAAWSFIMAPHVARVKASLDYHAKELKTIRRALQFPMILKAQDIHATGFPFKFQVMVKGVSLTAVEINETFAVSIAEARLESVDDGQGIYRVIVPNRIEALYAKDGSAPEQYVVLVDGMPNLNLSAVNSKVRCGPMTGKVCENVPADAPLISYAIGFPVSTAVLHVELNGEKRDATFHLPPINVPIYDEIPGDMSRVQQVFINVLRELMVFKAKVTEEKLEM